MKVLHVASECVPFVKTGGLGDVTGALPRALAEIGVETRVMLPGYRALRPLAKNGRTLRAHDDFFGGPARLVEARAEGLELLILDAPHLYDRPGGPYLSPKGRDWPDNARRFGALSRAAADLALGRVEGWTPDLLHAHDWQAGLAPAYLALDGGPRPPSVFTIHNIAFPGRFPPSWVGELGLPDSAYAIDGLEYYHGVSFLKAGLVYADRLTTVSPTYARELTLHEYGMGMEGVINARRRDFSGVLNGVDLTAWNPETDPALARSYSRRSLGRRAENRAATLERFGLAPDLSGPLFVIISRMTRQKGLDLLLDALPRLLARGAGLAVLGSGDAGLETGFLAAAEANPGRIGVRIGYDEPLAHLMQGGGDAILIPSRFEPCGLTQLYALRYGCLPVVARTGGLADTVIDANPAARAAGVGTGFQFSPVALPALVAAIDRTCDLWSSREEWTRLQTNGMAQDVGWARSAAAYKAIYGDLLGRDA